MGSLSLAPNFWHQTFVLGFEVENYVGLQLVGFFCYVAVSPQGEPALGGIEVVAVLPMVRGVIGVGEDEDVVADAGGAHGVVADDGHPMAVPVSPLDQDRTTCFQMGVQPADEIAVCRIVDK